MRQVPKHSKHPARPSSSFTPGSHVHLSHTTGHQGHRLCQVGQPCTDARKYSHILLGCRILGRKHLGAARGSWEGWQRCAQNQVPKTQGEVLLRVTALGWILILPRIPLPPSWAQTLRRPHIPERYSTEPRPFPVGGEGPVPVQSSPTLWDPINCRPPGSSVHGILQARILEWVAVSSFRRSFRPRDWTWVSCIGRRILYYWAICETPKRGSWERIYHFPWKSKGERWLTAQISTWEEGSIAPSPTQFKHWP